MTTPTDPAAMSAQPFDYDEVLARLDAINARINASLQSPVTQRDLLFARGVRDQIEDLYLTNRLARGRYELLWGLANAIRATSETKLKHGVEVSR